MKKLRVVRERFAETDLTEHVLYLAEEQPTVALRFIDAVEKAFRRLSEMPEIGVLHEFDDPRLAGTRMWPVPKFPRYMIFYQARGEEIRVLRVLHGARDIAAIFDAGDS